MKSFKKTLFVITLLLSVTSLIAQNENKDVYITSSGSGQSIEIAKQIALRSSLEQAFGAFISSKTEILNDQVVVDEMISVSSGSIKSYEILNEIQFPNGAYGITLKVLVSIDKLTSFVQAKGKEVELKGGLFALNVKQQMLNEEAELKVINEMINLLNEPMQISFDYLIKSDTPKSLDNENKNWSIPLEVTATANKNMDFCAEYTIKILSAVSLSPEEVKDYEGLHKETYKINLKYKGSNYTFYLRNKNSFLQLSRFVDMWLSYVLLFEVQTGLDEISNNIKKGDVYPFTRQITFIYEGLDINFLTNEQVAGIFKWEDVRSLEQIEKITGYKVNPKGVKIKFKYGGLVVYEENGHGIVVAFKKIDKIKEKNQYLMTFDEARQACDNLVLNDYDDWRLPSLDELVEILGFSLEYNIDRFKKSSFWYVEEGNGFNALAEEGQIQLKVDNRGVNFVLAVRSF